MKRMTACFVAIVLITTLFGSIMVKGFSLEETIGGQELGDEKKIYCEATLEDDFAGDSILVVLSNEASLEFNLYGTNDFSEIDCSSVYDLTEASGIKVLEKICAIKRVVDSNQINFDTLDVSGVDTYHKILRLKLEENSKHNVLRSIEELMKRDDVICAEPDYAVYSSEVVSMSEADTVYWALDQINLPEAWEISTGSADVVVGIIDSGIDASHPDLADRVPLEHSWDFTLGEDYNILPTDPYGHGTEVAGIIGAIGNEETGFYGICREVTLASLRVLDSNGTGYVSNIALAIEYAERNRIPILNMSLNYTNYSATVRLAIQNYYGLFVSSAGNGGLNVDVNTVYPTSYNFSNLISVGSSILYDEVDAHSNYGKTTVDIFAPGQLLISTSNNADNRYCITGGTSMSSPFVAGVAALILSIHPELEAYEIKQIILESADEVVYLSNLCVCGGRLNAYSSLISSYVHNIDIWPYNQSYHAIGCTDCEYVHYEIHLWNSTGTKCLLCGYTRG